MDRVEVWLDVVGGEGSYQVSNIGRVRSLDRYVSQRNRWGKTHIALKKGKLLSTSCKDKDGYCRVSIHLIGRAKTVHVHRLVADAFHKDSYFQGAVVNHKDHNKSNNNSDNLEWVTLSYNSKHSFLNGNRKRNFGEDNPYCKITDDQVEEIRKLIPFKPQREIAKIYGVDQAYVSQIKLGKTRKVKTPR